MIFEIIISNRYDYLEIKHNILSMIEKIFWKFVISDYQLMVLEKLATRLKRKGSQVISELKYINKLLFIFCFLIIKRQNI